jgi:1-pyrroline-5-carboxylate dehydrogenase
MRIVRVGKRTFSFQVRPVLSNYVNGEWKAAEKSKDLVNPLTGQKLLSMPDTQPHELAPFLQRMAEIPKSGLHNAFKNPERALLYGEISHKMAVEFGKPEVLDRLARTIMAVCPKTYKGAVGEVEICKTFLQNFGGDQVRFLAKGFSVSGDHAGQQSFGYRWPFGACVLIAPFNFPLEIPLLQLMGALYMGNHVTLKCASTTSLVMEEVLRIMIDCGMPAGDVNLLHCGGRVMNDFLVQAGPLVRNVQFTGSSGVAEDLAVLLHGKIKVEDAGFDWKLLGPDVADYDFVAYTCDQDAYAHTGQKCSAQSILLAHENWVEKGLYEDMAKISAERTHDDLSIGPVLSVTTKEFLEHTQKCAAIPGAKVLFGGKALEGHSIPACYGAVVPTAVHVPLHEIPKHFDLVTTELFAPFQIVTTWKTEEDLQLILELFERMHAHLTAAVVSTDQQFINRVIGSTVNGTTYAGIRARTTGAPQNHWFGPAGDPRGAGIGSPEAIRHVWSGHREVIRDDGPVQKDWKRPKPF